MRRFILVPILVMVALLAIVGGVAYWGYNNYIYYTTDDAQVTGPIVSVSSPQSGLLNDLKVQLGSTVAAGDVVATVSVSSTTGTASKIVNVTTPIAGTVIQTSAVQGQGVAAGLSLLQVTDLNHLSITAYVDESQISNIKLNQDVDVKIDAYSGTSYTGHVQRIVAAAASEFSLLPSADYSSGNFTKVSQRIPVIISFSSNNGNAVVPGMSAEVTIHIH
jgi:multidrug resistance efflux pump